MANANAPAAATKNTLAPVLPTALEEVGRAPIEVAEVEVLGAVGAVAGLRTLFDVSWRFEKGRSSLRIDNVDNTAIHQHVCSNNLGTVDGNDTISNLDGELLSREGGDVLAILQAGRIGNRVGNNVEG